MKEINSMEQWNKLAARLAENGWTLYQWQYNTNDPEGFHARFWKADKPCYEVMTRDEDVYEAIIKFRPK